MNNVDNRAQQRAREIDMGMRDWLNGGLNREDGRLAIFDTFGDLSTRLLLRQPLRLVLLNLGFPAQCARSGWYVV